MKIQVTVTPSQRGFKPKVFQLERGQPYLTLHSMAEAHFGFDGWMMHEDGRSIQLMDKVEEDARLKLMTRG